MWVTSRCRKTCDEQNLTRLRPGGAFAAGRICKIEEGALARMAAEAKAPSILERQATAVARENL
jgi:hypothetical protein